MKPKELLEPLQELSVETAAFIKQEAGSFDRSLIEYKGVNDLVSYVDKEAEKKLVTGLDKLLPGAGFLTEEGTTTREGEEYLWIVDPLDGTTNFTHGIPVFAISIALVRNGKVVLGLVHEINRNELFCAAKDEPALCNNVEIRVSPVTNISEAVLATGFPYYEFEGLNNYFDILQDLMRDSHGLRRLGSAAVDLAYVACGRFEGFFEYNLNPWDVAGGGIIVEQAGGTVTDFSGSDDHIFRREIVAANSVHPNLLSVIQSHWVAPNDLRQ